MNLLTRKRQNAKILRNCLWTT